jgi:hypothetical protein
MSKISTGRRLCLVLASALLSLAALVGAAASLADAGPEYKPVESPNPTRAECMPGQPYNRHCMTIVTFDFPKEAKLSKGRVPIVKLGCNNSCNHVFFTLKHGKHFAAKSSTWYRGNYTPEVLAKLTPWGKKQLDLNKKLGVVAKVCVHPPGPQNFCKSHRVMLRA